MLLSLTFRAKSLEGGGRRVFRGLVNVKELVQPEGGEGSTYPRIAHDEVEVVRARVHLPLRSDQCTKPVTIYIRDAGEIEHQGRVCAVDGSSEGVSKDGLDRFVYVPGNGQDVDATLLGAGKRQMVAIFSRGSRSRNNTSLIDLPAKFCSLLLTAHSVGLRRDRFSLSAT